MKSEKSGGSLFGLLAKNYLLFTLTLFVIAGAVYLLWNAQLDRLYEPSDWTALTADKALAAGEYEKLKRYIHGDGYAFAVLNSDGKNVYASDDSLAAESFTPGELACMREYGSSNFWEGEAYSDASGNAGYRVTEYSYGVDSSLVEQGRIVLDSQYRVVSGGLDSGRTGYTQREYEILTGTLYKDAELCQFPFTSDSGQTMALIIKDTYPDPASFYRDYQASWRIWLLFVPLYLLAAGGFIFWLNRKIRLPLDRLNEAVNAQTHGRAIQAGNCGGTSEIRQIGESFDRLSQRLAKSEQERRRLDDGRQKLLADISHDLKTPVTVISGYAGAICDGKIPPDKQKQCLSAIRHKAENLTELINAFHEYSKVEHPEFSLQMSRMDICEFSREYLAKKYDEIDLAGFTLEPDIPDGPIYCQLDELQFRRVLDNLISNSLKYNRLDTVLFFDIKAGDSSAQLTLADNGLGIPSERAKTIFEPFVVGSEARNGGGSGLGLAITRRIVELHGGTIRLTPSPAPERSTEFVIVLPLEK